MFLTAQQIAEGRDYTLNNLLGMSAACLQASQRLSELLASSSREALHAGTQHMSQIGHGQLENLTRIPATLWLEHSSRSSKLLGNAYEIVGETHKMLVHSSEAQMRVVDGIAFASIDRLSRNSPWEAMLALQTARSTLESAEQGLRGASSAVIEQIERSEQEIQQFTEALQETNRQKPKATPRSRSKADQTTY